MIDWTLRHDGYFTTYMHPWEFYNLNEHPEWKIQGIIRMNCGSELQRRFDLLIKHLKGNGADFVTYSQFVRNRYPNVIE
jgi:hypothetical protein